MVTRRRALRGPETCKQMLRVLLFSSGSFSSFQFIPEMGRDQEGNEKEEEVEKERR